MDHDKKTRIEEKNNDLSIKKIIKNGFQYIKNRKTKFVVTIALIVLTLISISIYDTVSNYEDPIIKNYVQLLLDNDEQFVQIEKSDFYYRYEITTDYKVLIDNDVKQINQKLKKMNKTGNDIYRIADLHIESNNIMGYAINIYDLLEINPEFRDSSNPYTYWWDEFDIVEWDDFNDFFINDIIGRMPKNSNEIMISNYFADLLLTVGLKPYEEDDYYIPASYEELVNSNKYFHFGVDKVKIVGIINYDLSEFEILRNTSWDELNSNYKKYSDINLELSYRTKNIYNKIYVDKDFISHLKVNDSSTLGPVWQNKVIKVGTLVKENIQSGFEKLLSEFRYDEPITARSTYSELVDSMMKLIDSLPDMSLISRILFCCVIFLIIVSAIVLSRFVLPKRELKELNNQTSKKSDVKKILLCNIALTSVISILLSSISLVFIIYFLKTSMVGDNAILNPLFVLGIRQFAILFLSMIGIGMISYLISIVRIKIAYNSNK